MCLSITAIEISYSSHKSVTTIVQLINIVLSDNILRERRLRWLGHVFRMDQQALYRIQERARSTKSELEERSQQRPTKYGVHLGGSRGGSS